MASFASDDVSGPISEQGTPNVCFTVALPGGGEGRAVVGTADAMANAFDEPTWRCDAPLRRRLEDQEGLFATIANPLHQLDC